MKETMIYLAAFGNIGAFFSLDRLALAGAATVLLSTVIAVIASLNYIFKRTAAFGEYLALLLFAALGACLMVSSSNLIVIFIGLELLSVSSYVLAGYNSGDAASVEAAIKYFTLGAIASAIFIFGIAFYYGASGGLDVPARSIGHPMNGAVTMYLAAALIMAGLSFKSALVPFQWWVADVYQGAPLPVTSFFATTVKAAAFVVLFRFVSSLNIGTAGLGLRLPELISVIAAATMTFGNLAALLQEDAKRMLAYSSVAHAGYLLLAVLSGGANAQAAGSSLLFYLLAYVLMTAGAFAVLIYISTSPFGKGGAGSLPPLEKGGRGGVEHTSLSSLSGLGRKSPWLAASLAVFMLALAGVPPTGGFFAKFFIFKTAVQSGWTWLVIVAVLNSVVSVYYYMRPVVSMYFGASQETPSSLPPIKSFGAKLRREPEGQDSENYPVVAVIAFCLIATILLGLLPNSLLRFLGQ